MAIASNTIGRDVLRINQKIKISILILGLEFAIALPTLAQNITLDGTLGDVKTLTGPNYTIRQKDGQTVGNNLFHSFGRFGLNAGEAAIFQSNPNIQNILSRVTGGVPSFIDGTLKTESASVNLFLINPSGITFGANASLKVNGSFVATSANAIQFGDKGFFSATEPQSPALLTVNPSALFFNQIQAGQIKNQSITPLGKEANGAGLIGLRVPDGNSLLLVGGDIVIDGGGLNALGGRIELAGVGGTGTVGLDIDGSKLSLNVPDNITLADVSIINGSQVSVNAGNDGSIVVNARNLAIEGSFLVAGIGTGNGSIDSQAGDITLNADETIRIDRNSLIFNDVFSGSIGNGGNILITAGSLSITNGSQLSASTNGQGNAGNVIVDVRNTTLFDGVSNRGSSSASSRVGKNARGQGGDIRITTDSLSIANGAQLDTVTFGQGNAGNITIIASDTVSFSDNFNALRQNRSGAFSSVRENARGQGGNIHITTRSLSLTEGSQLSAAILGEGDAGNITIDARDTVLFDGITDLRVPSGAFSAVFEKAKGQGKDIRITTGSLSVTNGAQLVTGTRGQGDAGSIIINARDTVLFEGVGGLLANTFPQSSGIGGDISINTQQLTIQNGATITASSEGKGNAGNILNITARNLTLDNGSITTTSLSGNGGNIENLQVQDLLLLRNQSQISTTAGTQASGGGNGGNININAGFLVAVPDENSDITANAFEGMGGNINITTNGIFGLTFRNQPTLQSDITASSQFGINGIIAINTPEVNPLSALDTLPINPVDAEKLVAQNVCAIKDSKIAGGSSFIITGKGGLPPNPNETLTNLTGIVEWATNDRSQTRIETPVIIRSRPQTHQPEPITPIQGWVKNSDGTITLTTTAPTVTPQSPSFIPQDCNSAS